jgi:hypothetical protein
MKKAMARRKKVGTARSRRAAKDDILPEYDFSRGRPNPYAQRYSSAENLVKLDPDVAAVFPDARAVNHALRALAEIIEKHGSAEPRQRQTRAAPRAARGSR